MDVRAAPRGLYSTGISSDVYVVFFVISSNSVISTVRTTFLQKGMFEKKLLKAVILQLLERNSLVLKNHSKRVLEQGWGAHLMVI